jgi:hypothetical protein
VLKQCPKKNTIEKSGEQEESDNGTGWNNEGDVTRTTSNHATMQRANEIQCNEYAMR